MKKIWNTLSAPWLARLLRERVMCRVMAGVGVLLLGAHLLGISLWPCMFARVTGRPCHGCGLTRAMGALLRGDWGAVMIYHPFAPFFAAVGVLVFLSAVLPSKPAETLARGVHTMERRTAFPAVVMMIFLCFGLLRMGGLCHNQHRDRLVPETSAFKLLRFQR